MDDDKIWFVGDSNARSDYSVGSFLSPINLDEFNIIIIQPRSVLAELGGGVPVAASKLAQLALRFETMNAWVKAGHALIVLGPEPLNFVNSISPNGQAVTQNLQDYQPLAAVQMVISAGRRIETCCVPPASELLKPHLDGLQYGVLLSGEDLVPLLRVSRSSQGSSQIVGAYRRLGKGLVIFVPPPSGQPGTVAIYVAALTKLPKALSSSPVEYPDWITSYKTIAESEASKKITELSTRVEELNREVAIQRLVIEESLALKKLLVATDAVFVDAVARALKELGILVVDGPHPRADLLATNGVRFAAIEAKGLEGPTKEKDVRQVVQWMAEVDSALAPDDEETDADLSRYIELLTKLQPLVQKDGRDCKGLLIVGTYRKLSLAERVQESFPEPVTRVLERSDICAFTGLQLLGLVLEARRDPAMKSLIINELFETRGVLKRALDWREFLI